MTTQKLLVSTLVLAATAVAQPPQGRGGPGPGGPGGRFIGAEVGIPGRTIKNSPFSAEIVTETTQILPDGNRIKQSSTVRVYRDSDGRTRHEQSLNNLNGLAPNSTLPQVAFINDPVGGAHYALNLSNRTATKSGSGRGGWGGLGAPAPMGRRGGDAGPGQPPPDAGGPRPMMHGRNNANVKTESLGRQMIEGVQADGTRTTMTIPAGQIGNEQAIQVVSESWYSPELQTVVLRKRSDPRSGETVTRYTNVSRAEPPKTFFEVPADFKLSETRGPRPRQAKQ
jgi:hypothetical protein